MIVTEVIKDFTKKADIVSCFMEHNGKHLLLQRQPDMTCPNQWGPPAGKVNSEEELGQAIVREILEESGIVVAEKDLSYFGSVDGRHGDFDFTYHIFSVNLNDRPTVTLSPREHQAHTWATPEEALKMNLVEDQDWCVKWFYAI